MGALPGHHGHRQLHSSANIRRRKAGKGEQANSHPKLNFQCTSGITKVAVLPCTFTSSCRDRGEKESLGLRIICFIRCSVVCLFASQLVQALTVGFVADPLSVARVLGCLRKGSKQHSPHGRGQWHWNRRRHRQVARPACLQTLPGTAVSSPFRSLPGSPAPEEKNRPIFWVHEHTAVPVVEHEVCQWTSILNKLL